MVHRGIDHLGFEDWVYFVFDHPAEGPQWYWGDDAREHVLPGATTFVRKSVSNVKPALMVRSPVAVLRGVSPGLVWSRVGGASHKQNSRDSKHDFPAHDQLLCSVAILVCSTYATALTFGVR
jgi:hypothetical protein